MSLYNTEPAAPAPKPASVPALEPTGKPVAGGKPAAEASFAQPAVAGSASSGSAASDSASAGTAAAGVSVSDATAGSRPFCNSIYGARDGTRSIRDNSCRLCDNLSPAPRQPLHPDRTLLHRGLRLPLRSRKRPKPLRPTMPGMTTSLISKRSRSKRKIPPAPYWAR